MKIKNVLEYEIKTVYREIEVVRENHQGEQEEYRINRVGSDIQVFRRRDKELVLLTEYHKNKLINSIENQELTNLLFSRDDDLCYGYCKKLLDT